MDAIVPSNQRYVSVKLRRGKGKLLYRYNNFSVSIIVTEYFDERLEILETILSSNRELCVSRVTLGAC